MADVDISVSLTGLRAELEKGLAPLNTLLQKLANSKDVNIRLDKQGIEFFEKQLTQAAGRSGRGQAAATAAAEEFRELVRSFNQALDLTQAKDYANAQRSLKATLDRLQSFITNTERLAQELSSVTGAYGQLRALLKVKKDGTLAKTFDPKGFQDALQYVHDNAEALFAQFAKREREQVRQAFDGLLSRVQAGESGRKLWKEEWNRELFHRLMEADQALKRYVGSMADEVAEAAKALDTKRAQLEQDAVKTFRRAVVTKGLQKVAPDVDADSVAGLTKLIGGDPGALVEGLFRQFVQSSFTADMAAKLGVEGMRDAIATTVAKLADFMRSNALAVNKDFLADLEKNGGMRAFPALQKSLEIYSERLTNATAEQVRQTAEKLRHKPQLFQLSEDIADMVADALLGAAKFLESRGTAATLRNQVSRAGAALLAREYAKDDPDADFYNEGRQRRQSQLIDTYLDAFLPELAKRLRQLDADPATAPQAQLLRGRFISTFGPSIDAAQGLLLNTLANFVSGLGVAAVFGMGYTLVQYVQDMETLNRELQAYQNILRSNGEAEAAQNIEALRERVLDLSVSANAAVQEVAQLFGFFSRNQLSTEGVDELLRVSGFVTEAFAVPFDALRQQVQETLLAQRQKLIGPDVLAEVIRTGGPQADQALQVFNKLLSANSSITFSIEELTKATRYYVDTGRAVSDNYYDIAQAVQYGSQKYEEHLNALSEVEKRYRSVGAGTLLSGGREEVSAYQRRLGLLTSRGTQEALADLGIGGPSVALASMQTTLLGFVELIRLATDLVGKVLDATGPLGNAVRAAAGQVGVALTLAALGGFFRLMAGFVRSIAKNTDDFTKEFTKTLAESGLDPKKADAVTGQLKSGRGVLGKLVGGLDDLVLLLGAFGKTLLRFLGPAGVVAAVLTAVGALAAQVAKAQEEAIASGKVRDFGPKDVKAGDGNTVTYADASGKKRTVALDAINDITAAEIVSALNQQGGEYSLNTPRAKLVQDLVNKARAIGRSVQDIDQQLAAARQALDQTIADTTKLLQQQGITHPSAVIAALQANPRYRETQELIKRLEGQKRIVQATESINRLAEGVTAYESATQVIRQLLEGANRELESRGVLLNADPLEAPTLELEAKLKALDSADAQKLSPTARAKARNELLENYARGRLAGIQRERALAYEAAQLLPSDFARLNELLRLKQKDLADYSALLQDLIDRGAARNNPARVELEQLVKRTQLEVEHQENTLTAFEMELTRQRDQVRSRLFNAVREVFYPTQGGNSATGKLYQAVSQVIEESLSLGIDQFISTQKAVFEELAQLKPLAQAYDAQVSDLERRFAASRRATDPKQRFENIQTFIDQGLRQVESGQMLTGSMARFLELFSDQLFKDGGQLSQLQQYTEQGLTKLKRLGGEQRPSGLAEELRQFVEGFGEATSTLSKLTDMERQFRQNVAALQNLGGVVYGKSAENLKKLLAAYGQQRARLEAKAKQGKLTPQEVALLTSYREEERRVRELLNLDEELGKAKARLNELLAKKQKGGLSRKEETELKGLSAKVAQLESKLSEHDSSYSDLLDRAEGLLGEMVDAVLNFSKDFGTELSKVTLKLEQYGKNVKKQLQETLRSIRQRAEAFRPGSFKADTIARRNEEFEEFKEQSQAEYDVINDLQYELTHLRDKGLKASSQQLLQRLRKEKPELLNLKVGDKTLEQVLNKNLELAGDVLSDIITALADARKTIKTAQSDADAYRKAANVEDEYNRKLERARKLAGDANEAAAEGRDAEAQQLFAQAEALRQEAQKLYATNTKLLEAGGSDLEALADAHDEVRRELERIRSEMASRGLDNRLKAMGDDLDRYERSLEYLDTATAEELGTLLSTAGSLYDRLGTLSADVEKDAQLSPADRENLRQRVGDALHRVTQGFVKLAEKGLLDLSSLEGFTAQAARYGVDARQARGIYAGLKKAQFEASLERLRRQSALGDTATAEDIEREADRLGRVGVELDALLQEVDQLGALGVNTTAYVETVVELLQGVSQALKTLDERRSALEEKNLRRAVEAASRGLDDALASGQGVEGALQAYLDALKALRAFAEAIPDADRREALLGEVRQGLASLSGRGGMGLANLDFVKLLLGFTDPLQLLGEVGAVVGSQVNGELVRRIQQRLKERLGVELGAKEAEAYAKAILEAARRQVEGQIKQLEAAVGGGEANLKGLLDSLAQGNASLADFGKLLPALQQLEQLRTQLFALKVAQLDPDDPQYQGNLEELRQQHRQQAEQALGLVTQVHSALESGYKNGRFSYQGALNAAQGLSDSLSLLLSFIETIAEALKLTPEQKESLRKAVAEVQAGLTTFISQLRAEPLRLLTGQFSSRELAYRQAAQQAFGQTLDNRGAEGAASALYALPQQLLQQAFAQPFATPLAADARGKLAAQRNYVQQQLALKDEELLQLYFGDDARKLGDKAKEVAQYLRAGLRGVLKDLEEQDLKELEAVLEGIVQQLKGGIENLFFAVLNVPARMLQEQYQLQQSLRVLEDRGAALEDERKMYEKLYAEAVAKFGATSAEAERYRAKLAEVTQAQREWSDEFKRTKESAKGFFDYVLEALGNFMRMLAEMLTRYAAQYVTNAIVGALLPSGSGGGGGSTYAPSGGVQNATMKVETPTANPAATVGNTLASAGISSLTSAGMNAVGLGAAMANPTVALAAAVAGVAMSAAAEEVGRWFDKNRFTFKEGRNAKGAEPAALDFYSDGRKTVINVNAAFERQQLLRETARALDRKLRDEEV
jgi:hypothetical protein